MPINPLADLTALRKRTSSKWRRFAPDVLPMHVAEMDYDIAENIKELLLSKISNSDIGYTGPVPEAIDGFVDFAAKRWGWQVDPKQVRLSTDVGVSAVEIFRALGNPGDKVVINSPVYSSFYGWIEEVGFAVHDVPLIANEHDWELDLKGLEAAFSNGAKFYLICHPHNPLGKLFTRDELSQIAELAKKYDVFVISDEIHAPLTFAGQEFVPYLSVSDAAKETGVCITAASKSWNLAGLKASVIVTDSHKVVEKLHKLPAALHWRSGILGAFAMGEAFSKSTDWLEAAIELNRKSLHLFMDLMAKHLPNVKYWVPKAGYLVWLDVSSLEISENPALTIIDEQRVSFVPGVDHGKNYGQYLRINFACHPESLEKAVMALAAYAK